MKKMLILVMALVISVSIFATTAVVDTQQVFRGYSKTKIAETKLQSEKTKLEGQLAIKAKNLQKIADELNAKGDKVTVVEKDKFQKQQTEFSKERQALQTKLGALEQEEMGSIQKEILSAVKRVAAQKKYDLVVEKGAVLYGGKDITIDVLKTLESSKKIDLN